MDQIEKIYCSDRGSDAALAAALASKGNSDPAAMAAMMNGNNWQNNPFAYLIWLVFAMRMWNQNGDGLQNNAIQSQLDAMRSQMQDNQNSNLLMDAVKGNNVAIGQLASNLNCDFNSLSSAICDVRAGIDKVAGQVGFSSERVINAVQSGSASVIQALQNCCCQTQTSIASLKADLQLQSCKDTAELRNGQRDLGVAMAQGFAATNYERQKQTCDILQAGTANTQRIVDVLNSHWQAELQQKYDDARLELSQLRQNATLIAALKGTTTTTATA